MFPAILKNIASSCGNFWLTRAQALEGVNHAYVIAEIRTRPGQHHRQAVLDRLLKSFQPY